MDTIPQNIYEFKVEGIDGSVIDFSDFKGKKILIVNTASYCGFTPQYEQLQQLYLAHADKLMVIGFPSNSFMFQEPLSNQKIANFCSTKFHVTFPLAAKIAVKGKSIAPIYHWLTEKKYNGLEDSSVKWNFHKYIIDEQGQLLGNFPSTTTPDSKELMDVLGL